MHLLRGLHVNTLHAIGLRQGGRTGNQGDFGARFKGGSRQCIAGLTRRTIRDHAHWINRLDGWASGDQDAFVLQELGLKKSNELCQNLQSFEHSAIARFAARLLSRTGSQYGDTILLKLRDVALRGGCRPHFAVHGGCD